MGVGVSVVVVIRAIVVAVSDFLCIWDFFVFFCLVLFGFFFFFFFFEN